MKTKYFIFIILLALCACKTQSTLHYPQSTIIRDSISITYKQGQEQPTPIGVKGAAIESRKNSCVPADGSVGVGGATQGASVFEGLLSQRTNKPAVPPTTRIRVDTVFVERWHTTEVPSPPKPIPRFYKDCTWGFFILLLLIFGRIALKMWKTSFFHSY